MTATLLVRGTDDPRPRTMLQAALEVGELLEARSWRRVPVLLERHPVRAVVVDAASGRLPFAELGWLHRQHPLVATVVVMDARDREIELFRLGRQGVDALVLTGRGETVRQLRDALALATARSAARRVTTRIAGRAEPELADALAWAVEHADGAPHPDELARFRAPSPAAYRRTLRMSGLPSPSRILLWGRLLHAAHLLELGYAPVERVAHRLGYATATSLSRALRRETGHPPSRIRDGGGMGTVLDALLASDDMGPRIHPVGRPPRGPSPRRRGTRRTPPS